ncbi:hypothetical protein GCM10008013_23880 [Paenibacillus segetis]|uniref:Uncharacterized protein n=1 Tax=Paenibacillus segetis TaxID=1325360 RepID=A0ABQ1YGA7_9BACL|nr:hypothetical protein GCM10008013_23880 [Paenibacillus segetis]
MNPINLGISIGRTVAAMFLSRLKYQHHAFFDVILNPVLLHIECAIDTYDDVKYVKLTFGMYHSGWP